MASNDTLYMTLELKTKMNEQLQQLSKEADKLKEQLGKVGVDFSKIDISKNINSNLKEAEKGLFKLLDVQEKLNKAMSQGLERGFDVSHLQQASNRIDGIVNAVQGIGNAALLSKNAVKDLLVSLNAVEAMKVGRDLLSEQSKKNKSYDSDRKKQLKEEQRDIERMEKARIAAEKEAEQAAHRNAAAQDRVRDALAKIATARANLTSASEKGNQQEVAHAQLLISLLDRLAGKLNVLKGGFLGEKGVLDGVLGSGYKGLMRNVSTAIRNIGGVDSSIIQKMVGFENGDVSQTRERILSLINTMRQLGQGINHTMEAMGQGSRQTENQRTAIANMSQEYENLRKQLSLLWQTYRQTQTSGDMLTKTLGIGHLRGYTGPMQSLSDEAWKNALREAEVQEVASKAAQKHKKKLDELTKAFAEHDAQLQRSKQQQTQSNQARQQATQALRKHSQELIKNRQEILRNQEAQLRGLLGKGENALGSEQYQAVRNALRAVREEMRQIETVMQRLNSYSAMNLFNVGRGGMDYSPTIQHANQVLQDNIQKKNAAAQAAMQLTDYERRLAEAFQSSSEKMSGQSQMLGDLKTMLAQYLSLWGARSFVNNIIETGGLLEQQRLSIGAILGDAEQANELFEKIKQLALKSPFGVVELDRMSKQLTAYGFQYEELYDWTKRLADISAATGTEVSRLALALGHVRAEGALSGYTLRQFAMGNVPLLQKLSENLGITTKQVRERTKKKEISYEDVMEVLRQLTDEGGMFYQAQETMSQALNAKFKNLRDAFDIMYGEIAESSVGDHLKDLATTLTSMTKHWERAGKDIAMVAGAFGLAKAAVLLYNHALGMNVASTLKSAQAKQVEYVNSLRLARQYRTLTVEEERLLATHAHWYATSGKLTASQLSLILSQKKLTQEELLRAIAIGKINKDLAMEAVLEMKVRTEKEKQAKADMILGVQGTKRIGAMRMAWISLGNAIRSASSAIWGFTKMALPMAAMSAVFDLYNRWDEANQKIADTARDTGEAVVDQFNKVLEVQQKLNEQKPTTKEGYGEGIEDITAVMEKVGAMTPEINHQAMAIQDLGDKYAYLKEKLDETVDAYRNLKDYAEQATKDATDATDGWADENIIENLEDYDSQLNKYRSAASSLYKYRGIIKDQIDEIIETTSDNALKTSLIEMGNNIEEQVKRIAESDSWAEFSRNIYSTSNEVGNAVNSFRQHANQLRIDWETVTEDDLPKFVEGIKADFMREHPDVNLDNLNEEMQKELKILLHDWVSKIQDVRDEVKEEFEKELMVKFNLTVDFSLDIPTPPDYWRILSPVLNEAYGKVTDKGKQFSNEFYNKLVKNANSAEELWKHLDSQVDAMKKTFEAAKRLYGEESSEAQDIGNAYEQTKLFRDTVFGGSYKEETKDSKDKSDARLKAWREELKELENFYKIYKRNVQYMGKDDAVQKALDSGVFSDPSKLPRNIDDYVKVLRNFREKVQQELGKNPSVERKGFLSDLIGKIEEKEFEVYTKDIADKMLRALQEQLSRQSAQWNLYRQLLEKTGSETFARNAFNDGNIWDEQSRGLQEQLKASLGGSLAGVQYGWNQVEAEKFFEGNKQAYELWKRIVEIIRNNYTDALSKGADATKKLLSIDEQIAANEAEIKRIHESGEANLPGGQARITELNRQNDKLGYEKFQQSAEYLQFFGSALTMSREKMEEVADTIRNRLMYEFSRGNMTAHQYTKALKDVNDQMTKGRSAFKGNFGTFLSGGQQGMVKLREEEQANAAIDYELARKKREELEKTLGDQDLEKMMAYDKAKMEEEEAKKRLEAAAKALGISTQQLAVLSQMQAYIAIIKGIFSGFQQAAKSLSEFFKATGKGGAAETWEDIADGIGAVSSVLNPVDNIVGNAMKGNVSGVISSAISAPVDLFTAPITAFAKLHDKQNQREIEASKQRQRELETLTKNLESVLSRTLGGVYQMRASEDDVRKLKQYLAADTKARRGGVFGLSGNQLDGETRQAVEKALESGTYYDTKLAEMMLQKRELERQLASEEDKKDSDGDAIASYKQQIKEMEIELENFAIDMAKTLYDIDLKSWAQELGDALFEAWQKGEDGAEAFKKKASELIGQVAKKIIATQMIETALEPVKKTIVSLMEDTSGELNPVNFAQRVVDALDKGLGAIGNNFDTTMDAVDKALTDKGYPSLKDTSGTGTASSSIQGITEQTADLLASYINAIRADVSGSRVIAESQLQQLQALVALARTRNEFISDIYDILHKNVTGGNKFSIS